MAENNEQETLAVMLKNFSDHNFKRLLGIKESVDNGNPLTELEIQYLEGMNERAQRARTLVSKHDDYQQLFSKVVNIYSAVVNKAMENEKKS